MSDPAYVLKAGRPPGASAGSLALAGAARAAYRAVLMREPHAIPRRFPRVKILGNVTGEVSLLHDVTLLDLGEGGARLERAAGSPSTPSASCASRPPRGSSS